jgi:hypothetical protein
VSVPLRSGPESKTLTGPLLPGFPAESAPSGPKRKTLLFVVTLLLVNERSGAPDKLTAKLAPSRTLMKLPSVVVNELPEAVSRDAWRLRVVPGVPFDENICNREPPLLDPGSPPFKVVLDILINGAKEVLVRLAPSRICRKLLLTLNVLPLSETRGPARVTWDPPSRTWKKFAPAFTLLPLTLSRAFPEASELNNCPPVFTDTKAAPVPDLSVELVTSKRGPARLSRPDETCTMLAPAVMLDGSRLIKAWAELLESWALVPTRRRFAPVERVLPVAERSGPFTVAGMLVST